MKESTARSVDLSVFYSLQSYNLDIYEFNLHSLRFMATHGITRRIIVEFT